MKSIRKWSYNKQLQEKLLAKKPISEPQHNARRTFGILYQHRTQEDADILKKLKNKLKSDGKIVRTLGYVDEPRDVKSLSFKAISQKDIKWNGIPESALVDEFLHNEYDILICAIPHFFSATNYIIELSRAKLILGLHHDSTPELYDIILDCPDEMDLNDIFEQFFEQLKYIQE